VPIHGHAAQLLTQNASGTAVNLPLDLIFQLHKRLAGSLPLRDGEQAAQ
jgi:hypothetical protein